MPMQIQTAWVFHGVYGRNSRVAVLNSAIFGNEHNKRHINQTMPQQMYTSYVSLGSIGFQVCYIDAVSALSWSPMTLRKTCSSVG